MLSVKNLHKRFGDIKAVDDVSFHAARGETVVLMGPSGCGKSTTIRMINRLVEPDSGAIIFDGCDITHLKRAKLNEARSHIGYVFQQFNLVKRLTVLENVMLAPVLHNMEREAAHKKARIALCRVGLDGFLEKKASELSGGQQQRVAIARVLALEPKLILWDEPTASLDPILVREVLAIMEELASVHEITMLVVTHELSFALKVADKIILMQEGKIIETGAPKKIFTEPKSAAGRLYKELLLYQMSAGKRILD
jgi:polar amino acid transport system ATP-binding protein